MLLLFKPEGNSGRVQGCGTLLNRVLLSMVVIQSMIPMMALILVEE
jgi:hypothetical protein